MSEENKSPGTASAMPKPRRSMGAKVLRVLTFPLGDLSQLGQVGRRVSTMTRELHQPGRHESFMVALDRQGLTLADADERAREIRRMGWIYAGTATVALVLIALAPFMSAPLGQFFGAMGVLALCGARAVVSFFRVSQIRDRELYGFWSWVRGRDVVKVVEGGSE